MQNKYIRIRYSTLYYMEKYNFIISELKNMVNTK
jgi:hypothetical protein